MLTRRTFKGSQLKRAPCTSPGGPKRRSPLAGARKPVNRSGLRLGRTTISCKAAFAFSCPDMSENRTPVAPFGTTSFTIASTSFASQPLISFVTSLIPSISDFFLVLPGDLTCFQPNKFCYRNADSLTSLVAPVLVNDFFLSSAALLPLGTGFEGEPRAGARLGPIVYVVSRLVGLQGGT